MKSILTFTFASVFAFALAHPASAQQDPRPGAPIAPVGIYISAHGGATVGVQANPAASFGVEYGERFHRKAQAYVALSYFENLIDRDIEDDLSDLSDALSAATGRAWDISGQDRGVGLIAGGKYLFGDDGARGLYVGGGAGIINLKRRITEPLAGDVTAAVLNDFGLGNSTLVSESVTRPLVEGAIGYVSGLGPVRLDLGVRYRRAFQTGDTIQFVHFAAGFGVDF
jgi:hypothetical protein